MKTVKGAVLIISLILLMIMSLLVNAMLTVSQLSHKSAVAAQQQLQLSQRALKQHLRTLPVAVQSAPVQRLANCPASYAAWSANTVTCNFIRVDSEQFSDNRQLYVAYTSLLLQQSLVQAAPLQE